MTFDIGIIKLITTWLIFRTIDGYEISAEHVTWDEIDNVCKQHFLPEVFTNEVKDGLTKLLPCNEKIWLHAKSRPTNYLIWKGCHHLQLGIRLNQRRLKDNSISSCIRKTKCTVGSTIALKGDMCDCIKGPFEPKKIAFLPQNVSNQTCPQNLNEDCGCPGNLYSVYVLTKTKRDATDCITESFAKGAYRTIRTKRSCDDNVANIVQCWNGHASRFYPVSDRNMTWLEARRLCQGYSLELGGNKDILIDEYRYLSGEYWTPERSSFQLLWTELSGYSDKQCVAVVKDNSGELRLTENNCSSTFRAVCETSSGKTKFPVLVVIIAVVGGVVVLCVVILGIVCWKRRNRGRKRSPTVSNRLYDQVVCSNVPTKKPAQPKPGQDSNQGECSYAYQSVDPLDVNNTTSNEGHYDVTFIHSNNTHTLPVASGNIYDRCYGKSTGTPMDRNTYDNAESGHSFSASKDVDHYDTTRNVQPKSGAKICSEGDYDTVTDTSSCNKDA